MLFENYKGNQIAISTTHADEKNWTAQAEYTVPGKDRIHVKPPKATYDTEEDARQAALQAAIESIDKARISTGKF